MSKTKIPISIDQETLILALDKLYPKLNIRNINSIDFSLSQRELFFRLGQRSVVDMLIDELNLSKKGEY